MIKQYYKQALAQLRQHPLISIIGIVGTALSIFLIMLVVMMQQVKVAPFSPESNRNRFLHVHYMSISHKDWYRLVNKLALLYVGVKIVKSFIISLLSFVHNFYT